MTVKEIVWEYIKKNPMDDSDAASLMEQAERATKVDCYGCKYMMFVPYCLKAGTDIPTAETCKEGRRRG